MISIMSEFQISKHYNGEVVIKFFPKSHRYQLEGRKDYLIGVTTATSQIDKSRVLLGWASKLAKEYLLTALRNGDYISEAVIDTAVNLHAVKKEEAATIGGLVHKWAEDYIKGLNPVPPNSTNVRNGVLAFLRWIKENGVKFLASEKVVYSRKHNYVGTMDCIFTMAKEDHKIVHVGDFKTSSGFYVEMAFQVSAYQEAEAEEYGTKYGDKYILKFDKYTGEFQTKCFQVEEHEQHFQGFLSCLNLKRVISEWEKKHGYSAKKKHDKSQTTIPAFA